MEDETYHSQYYTYLQQLVSEYIDGGGFDAFYERVRGQINELVETDPTAFYSYDEYLTAVDTLYQVVKLRGQSIQGQLDGTIPSIEAEQRSSDALVDASTLDISVMGSMNTGGGGGGFGFNAPTASENTSDTPDATADPENTPPAGFDPFQFTGESRDSPDNPQQTDENAQNGGKGNSGGRPSMGNFPGNTGSTSSAASPKDLILYGVSLLVFAVAMLFAVLYHRKPRKR